MCYDNSIIHIGALFQKGVCDLAEKRKDRNGRVLKTGENQRKNGTYEWPMPLRWGKPTLLIHPNTWKKKWLNVVKREGE